MNPSQTPGPAAAQGVDPGRVTLRRLNKAEYHNTVRDLLGVTTQPTLPEEGILHGFDNIAEGMRLTPQHFVAYELAARELVDEALGGSARSRTIACEVSEAACRSSTLTTFMRRAWRRPATPDEVQGWVDVYAQLVATEVPAEEAFRAVLSGVILSPHFIYRVELDPDPISKTPHALSGYELATRLSYFLWSTMPDDALLDAAEQGLTDPSAVSVQVTRLLSDAKLQAFVDNFAGQWLNQRRLVGYAPAQQVYPSFDERLNTSARRETWLFFEAILKQDRPLSELLTADYSFWDQRLSQHYAVQSEAGSGSQPVGETPFERTSLPADRMGLLTHASVLMANAEPDRSSIVKRGVWVMSNLLCAEPPPPPAMLDTTGFDAVGDIQNQRERLRAHALNPTCASCHAVFDPAGIAFENYDGIGAYRTTDGGLQVDSTGTVVGIDFVDGVDFAGKLAADPRFAKCVADKLFTYAIGRKPGVTDVPYLSAAVAAAGSDPGFQGLIQELVTSDVFRMRRGE